jgi:lipopolysaccharide/colanic/teichoic acid biosynthesis glycosyltransferase
MFDNIDSFVAMSRENTSVHVVQLYPFDSDTGNYEFWNKLGELVGNLMQLGTLSIIFSRTATMTEMKPTLTGRFSLESCGNYGERSRFVRLRGMTMQRLKSSKVLLERFTDIP